MTRTVLIGDIATIHDKKRIPLNSRQRAERQGSIPYYGATGVLDYVDKPLFNGEYVLIGEDGENLRSKKSDLAFKVSGEFWVNNHAHIVQGNELWINDYIVNVFRALDITPYITGAAQPKLNQAALMRIPIYWPGEVEAKRIADILGTIDEKIELNRQMNETLEQMGQALFRNYFIDNPESKTWPKGKVSELGTVITGKTPSKTKSEYFGGEIQFLKVPDMHGQSIVIKTSDSLTKEGAASQKGKLIPKYSTCVSCIATVGLVSLAGSNLQTNQQINSIIPKNQEYKFYNYLVMLDKSELIKTMASGGTATPNLNKGHFENIKVTLPPIDVLAQFDMRVANLFEKIELNMREVENLQRLRDSLLPRLISGKIKL